MATKSVCREPACEDSTDQTWDRQQNCLNQHLPDQPLSAGSQSAADGVLLLAAADPRQHHQSGIDAAQKKNEDGQHFQYQQWALVGGLQAGDSAAPGTHGKLVVLEELAEVDAVRVCLFADARRERVRSSIWARASVLPGLSLPSTNSPKCPGEVREFGPNSRSVKDMGR